MPIQRLLQLVLLFALVLAPLTMMSAHAATPVSAGVAAGHAVAQGAGGHCGEAAPTNGMEPAGDRAPAKSVDCTIACSCMPPAAGAPARQAAFAQRVHPPSPLPLLTGLNPQAEPRPPRSS